MDSLLQCLGRELELYHLYIRLDRQTKGCHEHPSWIRQSLAVDAAGVAIIPGTHTTCRTTYLSDLTGHLRRTLLEVQKME